MPVQWPPHALTPSRCYPAVVADPARPLATYADLEALPENLVGEIVFGVLHAHPRPRPMHARVATRLTMKVGASFDSDEPDGWVILDEPEMHLGPHVIVPDVAGWRRTRMPQIPIDKAYFELPPDWVCEVLSPGTAKLDRGDKRRIYETFMVGHLWFVDPDAKTLEVQVLEGSSYRLHEIYGDNATVRPPPFESSPLDLSTLWAR
jgi:Uma2 family endonuclease